MASCICWNIGSYLAFTASMWIVQTKVSHCLKVHSVSQPDSAQCATVLETLKPLAEAASTGTALGLICGLPMCLAQGLLCLQTWKLASRMDLEPVVALSRPARTPLPTVQPQPRAAEMRPMNAHSF